jgi:hypothetical protein
MYNKKTLTFTFHHYWGAFVLDPYLYAQHLIHLKWNLLQTLLACLLQYVEFELFIIKVNIFHFFLCHCSTVWICKIFFVFSNMIQDFL